MGHFSDCNLGKHFMLCCICGFDLTPARATIYCKTLFSRRFLVSRFPYIENSLHFNFADFPINFIKQFIFCFFWCLKQMLLSKFVWYYCIYNTKNIAYHITEELIFYADKIMVMGNSQNLHCI